jgi:hypothetical protein
MTRPTRRNQSAEGAGAATETGTRDFGARPIRGGSTPGAACVESGLIIPGTMEGAFGPSGLLSQPVNEAVNRLAARARNRRVFIAMGPKERGREEVSERIAADNFTTGPGREHAVDA